MLTRAAHPTAQRAAVAATMRRIVHATSCTAYAAASSTVASSFSCFAAAAIAAPSAAAAAAHSRRAFATSLVQGRIARSRIVTPAAPVTAASAVASFAAAPRRFFASITLTNTSVQEFDAAHHHFLDALQSLLESPRFESLNLDVALSDGVLSVASPNHGTWVLNKHGPTRQLWLSSPVSGPAKFNFHRELEHGSGPASAASAAAAAPVSSVGEGWRGERDHNDSLKVKLIREWTAAFKQTIDPVDDFPPPH